jgi:hypothetical protein
MSSFSATAVFPQGETTSAIVGQVTDGTHAAISGALVNTSRSICGLGLAIN